ncbi:hypothetical protein CTEN210_00917 [Chaetoceros tenuissimus]|uniref:Peptidase M11 gametolysin domain-containing protein n=1 Tax=Chaetoceros tenuissimus TaxID=426638 RepID=A0AAD3CF27_9STRA|nr:hypothetical protein CTEN210_00917 [Chaetoceros tenuissimus]
MKLLITITKLTVLSLLFSSSKARLGEQLRKTQDEVGKTIIDCTISLITGLVSRPGEAHVQESFVCISTSDDDPILLMDDPRDVLGNDFINGVSKVSLCIEGSKKQVLLKESLIDGSLNNDLRRSLASQANGVKKVLVVRVVSARNSNIKPIQSEEQLFDDIFDDNNNMAVRFDECSGGKLKMIPATGNGVNNGVLTVSIDGDFSELEHWDCLGRAKDMIPSDIIRDHTMFVCPDEIDFGTAAALAYKPGTISWYLSSYVSIPLVQFHEISHNYGHLHSGGMYGQNYTDFTCNLGMAGDFTDRGSHYCFNAPKSWAWHWYDDFHAEVDPLFNTYNSTLVGINAVRTNIADDKDVVLKISSQNEVDLYLMYQRQVDANKDIPAYGNQVVITEQKEEMQSQSYMKKALPEGYEYVQGNWGGIVGNTLTVKVCSLDSTTLPGSAHVIVFDSNHKISCPPKILSDTPDPDLDEPSLSLPLCQDAAGRIQYNDGTRNCLFVSRKNTAVRCSEGVAEACPVTCMEHSGYQCQCEERPLKKQFNIRIDGIRTRKTCQDAIDDTSLCMKNKVRIFCPIVCKVETCF